MKKVLIIAAAAVVALAACTKVEKAETSEKTIGFQVAAFSAQTKAGEISILGETSTFKTDAWYHAPTITGAQRFMTAETVTFNTTDTEWYPSRPYYWPKSGYINFYSYYGTKTPTAVTDGTLAYTTQTIVATDNIVYANPALGQTQNLETYKKDGVTKGVPTLFHHALCQIAFDIKAIKTTKDNTTWDITVDSAKVVVANQGTLSFSTTAPTGATATASTPAWSVTSNTAKPLVGWTAASGSTETVKMTALGTNKLTTTAQSLLAMRSAMPQTLVATTNIFTITYTVVTKYNGTEYSKETITVEKALTDLGTGSVTEWQMNQKITYHVTIDPEGNLIMFDPAVVPWTEVTGGTIAL